MDFIGGQIDQMKAEKEQLMVKTNEDKNAFVKALLENEDIRTELSENNDYYSNAVKQMGIDANTDVSERGNTKGFFSRLLDLL